MIRDLLTTISDLLGGAELKTQDPDAGVFVYTSPVGIEVARRTIATHPRLGKSRWVNAQKMVSLPFEIEYANGLYAQVAFEMEEAGDSSITWMIRTNAFMVPRIGGAPVLVASVSAAEKQLTP